MDSLSPPVARCPHFRISFSRPKGKPMPALRFERVEAAPTASFIDTWKDLWKRCTGIQPSVQAECIIHWQRLFQPSSRIVWLLVLRGQRAVAGLPLIERTDTRLGRMWQLPVSSNVHAGDLLLDLQEEPEASCRELARGLSQLGFGWIRMEEVDLDAFRWQHFLSAVRQESLAVAIGLPSPTALIDIGDDWAAYKQSWSRNHRSALKRSWKKLAGCGKVEIECVTQAEDAVLTELMEQCFALEDRGWKGAAGTSIARVPGLREYYLREAQIMRDRGHLHLWLLRLDGQIIAFEYCHVANGVCYSHKLSFDPDYQAYSPGKILRGKQLESYFADPQMKLLDTLGTMCRAKAAWATRVYRSTRLTLSTGNVWSRSTVEAYRQAQPWVRRLRTMRSPAPLPAPGAARYLESTDHSLA
ncbi:MAG: GNAT family N-acetyltransferase [Planctomycetota bacterium]|nr:MAG: GNAT family N-acetyltransferase [Planctomycetota bacterium]